MKHCGNIKSKGDAKGLPHLTNCDELYCHDHSHRSSKDDGSRNGNGERYLGSIFTLQERKCSHVPVPEARTVFLECGTQGHSRSPVNMVMTRLLTMCVQTMT